MKHSRILQFSVFMFHLQGVLLFLVFCLFKELSVLLMCCFPGSFLFVVSLELMT